MLIFARVGVMKNDKKHVFIYHYPLILGHFFVFSSTKIQKRRGATTNKITQMTKEKNSFYFLTSVVASFHAPKRNIHIITKIAPPRHRYVFINQKY